MPENKEELFALIEEFDFQARLLMQITVDYGKDDLADYEKTLIRSYRSILEMLIMEHDQMGKTRLLFEKIYADREP